VGGDRAIWTELTKDQGASGRAGGRTEIERLVLRSVASLAS
jgi:hypothetical protein